MDTGGIVQRRNPREYLDRFIPNRSAMDFDYARVMLTQNPNSNHLCSSSAYGKILAETFNINSSRRILVFKNKPPPPNQVSDDFVFAAHQCKNVKPRRHIPLSPVRKLDAPDLLDDFYLNLLDWGSRNVVCIALGHSVYLWDVSDKSDSELVTVDEESGPVTSVKWAPDGSRIAVGLNNSEVRIWDPSVNTLLTTLKGGHRSRVGVMDWNNSAILTTGGLDGQIINNDVRVSDRARVVDKYKGHRKEVCGLKWSASGLQLASGGNDDLVRIWDTRRSTNASLHRLEEHTAAVKALSWCPFQSNLLASGGGSADRCIKFWNTHSGACLNSVDTGSQVCALLWNKNERELLSSHGYVDNQLILWKYPSMVKIAELNGHTSRVLYMAESPDGCTVASAAAGEDESLRFWDVFGDPKVAAPKKSSEPFAHFNRIR